MIEEKLNIIDESIQDLINLGKATAETHALYTYDLFCTAILNRSVNILRGFTLLMRSRNFIAAAPLVRVHLDTLLRLYASTLIPYNIDDFASKVLRGKQISDLKDRDGNKMRDGYLAKKISELDGLNWIYDVYKAGSGHIHFSSSAMFSSTKISSKDERVITGTIGKHDEFISENEKLGAAIRMHEISTQIVALVHLWKKQKEGYEKNKA